MYSCVMEKLLDTGTTLPFMWHFLIYLHLKGQANSIPCLHLEGQENSLF